MRKTILILSFNMFIISGIVAQRDASWTLKGSIENALNRNIQVSKGVLTNQAKTQRMPSASTSINQNFNWSRSDQVGNNHFTGINGAGILS